MAASCAFISWCAVVIDCGSDFGPELDDSKNLFKRCFFLASSSSSKMSSVDPIVVGF